MKKLTYVKRINNYKGGKGTLVIFAELHEDGDYKGKPIVFWSPDPNYQPASKLGWTMDNEGRINEPETSRQEDEERKFALAQKYGVNLNV